MYKKRNTSMSADKIDSELFAYICLDLRKGVLVLGRRELGETRAGGMTGVAVAITFTLATCES